jgi:hypothetical protein
MAERVREPIISTNRRSVLPINNLRYISSGTVVVKTVWPHARTHIRTRIRVHARAHAHTRTLSVSVSLARSRSLAIAIAIAIAIALSISQSASDALT